MTRIKQIKDIILKRFFKLSFINYQTRKIVSNDFRYFRPSSSQ